MIHFDNELKGYAKTNKVPISFDETMEFVIEQINKNNYKNILEIGTAIGFGSISMASFTNAEHIDTVEIDKEIFQEAEENIKSRKLNDKITAYNIDARQYLLNCNKKYDFIYLDGPKGQYINYLPMLVYLLADNGMIVADNLFFHGMVTGIIDVPASCRAMIKGLHNFINEITTNPMYDSQIYNIGDGVARIKIKK